MTSFIIFMVIAIVAQSSRGCGGRGCRVLAATRTGALDTVTHWASALLTYVHKEANMWRMWLLFDPRRTLVALFTFLFGLALLIHFILLSTDRFNWLDGPRRGKGAGDANVADACTKKACNRSGRDSFLSDFARSFPVHAFCEIWSTSRQEDHVMAMLSFDENIGCAAAP